MDIRTETPNIIQTFKMLYFQNKADWKYIYLEAKGDDKETFFYWYRFWRKCFPKHKEKFNK